MAAVTSDEVLPGLVVFLDADRLWASGHAETNADAGREVQGPHLFLILAVGSDGVCDTVPLFGEWAPGSGQLQQRLKSGSLPEWALPNSYFSGFQHWRVPIGEVVAASNGELTISGDRCGYALGAPAELQRILSCGTRNRNKGYRGLE